jgi:glycosyltransferase involved in cell wall biosynthesis
MDCRVLLVPDWVQWVTGTIAKSVVRFNPWLEATVISAPVVDALVHRRPSFFNQFQLVHFTCSYAPRKWLPVLKEKLPCVTSHHHVSDWELMKHNAEGDVVVVASRQWAEDLVLRGVPSNRIIRLPYGVDCGAFSPPTEIARRQIRRKFNIRDQTIVIGFFAKRSSNEYDRKGIDVFAKAIAKLRQILVDIAVIIVGPGWDDFVSNVRQGGLRCIYFPFLASHADLVRMYRALDFYWITSRIEGGPVPLLEAMSSEVCCVSTPVGLARDIIRDCENAALVEIDDWNGFADRTIALARDPALRAAIAREGRHTVLRTMDLGVVYPKIADVYTRAVTNFTERTGKSLKINIPAARSLRVRPGPIEDVPLNGIPKGQRRFVRMLESLSWADALMSHGQRRQAYSLLIRQCALQPQNSVVWRALARHLLPALVISKLTKLKKAYSPSD